MAKAEEENANITVASAIEPISVITHNIASGNSNKNNDNVSDNKNKELATTKSTDDEEHSDRDSDDEFIKTYKKHKKDRKKHCCYCPIRSWPLLRGTLSYFRPIYTMSSFMYFSLAATIFFFAFGVYIIISTGSVVFSEVYANDTENIEVLPDSSRNIHIKLNLPSDGKIFSSNTDNDMYLYYKLNDFHQNNHQYIINVSYPQLATLEGNYPYEAICKSYNNIKQDEYNGSTPCGGLYDSKFDEILNSVTVAFEYTDESGKSPDDIIFYNELSRDTTGETIYNKAFDLQKKIRETTTPWLDMNVARQQDYDVFGVNKAGSYYFGKRFMEIEDPKTAQQTIVWMRPAAFSSFVKLYGTIRNFKALVEERCYSTNINGEKEYICKDIKFVFNVTNNYKYSKDSDKAYLVQQITRFGGKKESYGLSYICLATGSLSAVLLIATLILYCIKGERSLRYTYEPHPTYTQASIEINELVQMKNELEKEIEGLRKAKVSMTHGVTGNADNAFASDSGPSVFGTMNLKLCYNTNNNSNNPNESNVKAEVCDENSKDLNLENSASIIIHEPKRMHRSLFSSSSPSD